MFNQNTIFPDPDGASRAPDPPVKRTGSISVVLPWFVSASACMLMAGRSSRFIHCVQRSKALDSWQSLNELLHGIRPCVGLLNTPGFMGLSLLVVTALSLAMRRAQSALVQRILLLLSFFSFAAINGLVAFYDIQPNMYLMCYGTLMTVALLSTAKNTALQEQLEEQSHVSSSEQLLQSADDKKKQ